MRNAFVAILAVGLCASFALADASAVGEFYDTRDVGILGHSAENMSNAGGASQVRAMKARQHFLLLDFDFEAIDAFVAANIEPGYTAKYELRLTGNNAAGEDVALVAMEMAATGDDWVEGDGAMNYALFNWSSGYAATYVDPDLGLDLSTGPSQWMWGNQFDAHRNEVSVTNANQMLFGTDNEPSWCELTQEFIDLQKRDGTMGNMQVQGFYTYNDNVYSNGTVYTREQNMSMQPMIKVSFVPEPASISLLVLGGVAALIRRKK